MNHTWLLFVRHGETDWNKEKRMQGQRDIPLNAVGEKQAEKVGKQLRHYPIDAMYASPLIRAYQTAKVIHRHHSQIPLYTHDLLKERSFGELEGRSFEEICNRYPVMAFDQNWLHPYFQTEGGESIMDVCQRGGEFLSEIIAKEEGKTVTIVSHGVTLRCMISLLLHLPLSYTPFYELGNTAITLIKKPKEGDAELHFINSLVHLEEKI